MFGDRGARRERVAKGGQIGRRNPQRGGLHGEWLEARLLLSRDIYVDVASPGPSHDGSSWANAYADLQLALGAAAAGDRILVADGVYKPTATTNRSISFALKNGVSLLGGYAGYVAANPDARNVALYPTILSGDIGTPGSRTDNSYHVITGSSGVTSATILDGFTITAGNANGSSSPTYYGGGAYLSSASPTLTNCTFSANSATGNSYGCGGGMYNSNSSPALTNCTFSGNSATGTTYGYGGAMYNSASLPALTNCAFSGNSADGGQGGGMYNSSSSVMLTNCTFNGNSAGSGGVMYDAYSSSPILTNCIIWGNAATNGPQICQSGGTITTSYSDIQGSYTGIGNINADPLFVRSPWTGPDGLFGTADDDYGDLRLRAGSPVLDIGSNSAIPAGITTDRAGNARIQDSIVDLGAYEGAVSAPVPKTIYLDLNAAGTNTGISWTDAFTSIQAAFAAAADGDSIHIADGTYTPTGTTDRTIGLALRSAVGVYGGYAGYGAANPNARDVAAYRTILSGEIGTVGVSSDNSYHVLTASGVSISAVLDGVTVTGGNANGSGVSQIRGGGLFATGSSPTLTNCMFSGNSASGYGGGMYNFSSSPVLTNCTFGGNSAGSYGGGMCNFSSSPALTNCTFSGNSSTYGGGVYNESSSPTLTNCIVWGSASSSSAVHDFSCTATITYSDIQGGYTGIGNINTDPLFVRAAWTGPDGVFGTCDDDSGDQHLRPGSPALDIGSNAAVSAGVTTDMAGNVRIQNGTVDLGAYEAPVSAPAAKTLYVDLSATGANTGTSWSDAFTSLQSALVVAADGDSIRVADGTYKPTGTPDRTIGLALRNAVAVYGGYAGYGAPNPNARDVAVYLTILSGDTGAIGVSSDNSYHVLTAGGVGIRTVLDGVSVTGGNANGSGLNQDTGGGLSATDSSLTVSNCTFLGNSAPGSGGGGMYSRYSSPTLSSCTFRGNSGRSDGGGMYNEWSTAALTNCAFSANSARSGGALSNYSSSPTVVNCTFSGNSASYGGGMYNLYYSSPTLGNCTFSGNSASQNGGGMSSYDHSSPTLTNCIVWGSGNPPIYNSSSAPVITYSNIQSGYTGIGNINADPGFVRSPSSGPDGVWGTADDDYGDLRLQLSSPAIDAGNNAAAGLVGVTTDLAGHARFVDIPTVPDTGSGTAPIIDMGAYEQALDTTAPTIMSVKVNDGSSQRSMVNKVVVTFSEAVMLVGGPLSAVKSNGAAIANVTVTALNPSGDQKTWELTFGGTGAVGGSLPDGMYKVVVSATGVSDLAGNHLVGDYSQKFHRLFGDVDGDRDVDAKDLAAFKQKLNRSAGYVWWLDFGGNSSVIDNSDYLQLRARLLKPILR